MMEFEKLDSASSDRRPKWKLEIESICDSVLMHLPPEIADEIKQGRVREIDKQLAQCFEEHRIVDGDRLILAFETSLRSVVMDEYRQGRLKPVSAQGEIEKSLPALQAAGYRGIEIDSILALLKPHERIIEIGIRSVRTSTRTISRDALVNVLKPATQTNLTSWTSQFPSENDLRELEEEAARRANPGRPTGSDAYNMDLPAPWLK